MKVRGKPSSQRALIEAFVAELRTILPQDWKLEARVEPTVESRRLDAMLEVTTPDGQSARVAIEAQMTIEPRSVGSVVAQLRGLDQYAPLVLSAHLSPRVQQMLTEAGVSWADATGNMRFSLERPPVLLQSEGAAASPWAERAPMRSLRGRGAAATVRALCDFAPPYTVSELAARAGLPIASVFRTVEFLIGQAMIEKSTRRGQIVSVDWQAILTRWCDDYSLLGSNKRVLTYIDSRGVRALMSRLETIEAEYVLTASAVAELVAPVAPLRLVVLYSTTPARLADQLGLTEVGNGANTFLIEPFASSQMQRPTTRNGLRCAALSQVAADLLTSPGRGPSEGEALLAWMEANEREWRA